MTSNPAAKMGLRRRPYAFTEQGVAMLSSVLHSQRAIDVNIEIMRPGGKKQAQVAAWRHGLKEGRSPLTASDCSALLREAFRPRWAKEVRLPERPPPHS